MFPVLSLSLSLVKDKHAEMMENRGPPFFCSWFCFMCSVKTDRGTKKKKKGLKTDLRRPVLSACPVLLLSATRPQSYSPTSIWDGHCATFFFLPLHVTDLKELFFSLCESSTGIEKQKMAHARALFFFWQMKFFNASLFVVLLFCCASFLSFAPIVREKLHERYWPPPSKEKLH